MRKIILQFISACKPALRHFETQDFLFHNSIFFRDVFTSCNEYKYVKVDMLFFFNNFINSNNSMQFATCYSRFVLRWLCKKKDFVKRIPFTMTFKKLTHHVFTVSWNFKWKVSCAIIQIIQSTPRGNMEGR